MVRTKTLLSVGITLGLGVSLAACGPGEEASGDVRPGPAGPGAVEVVMQDNVFAPDGLDVSAGSPVTIEVRNAGEQNHNLTIDELEVSTGPMESGDVMTERSPRRRAPRSSVAPGTTAWSARSSPRDLEARACPARPSLADP